MRRVLFRWHGMDIYSYPAMLYLGLVCGVVAGNYVAHRVGVDAGRVYIATLLLLIPALAGARLLHVAIHWDVYRREPARIWRRTDSGGAIYGGLPLALLVSIPLLSLLRLPFLIFWDIASITILVGMFFTRIGCFLNGCCAGHETDGWFGFYIRDDQGVRARRIPTQFLEAAWSLLLFIGAMSILNHHPFPGELFLFTISAYSAGRFNFEFTRQDQDRIGRLTVHQIISLALVFSAAIAFAVLIHG